MGWLIVALVVGILCITLVALNERYSWTDDTVGLDTVGTLFGCLSLFAALILGCCMVDTKDNADVVIAEYNYIKDVDTELGVPSEAVMEKTIHLNDAILEHRIRSESFMTKGLYSKDVAALPLLDIPNTMKNVDFD